MVEPLDRPFAADDVSLIEIIGHLGAVVQQSFRIEDEISNEHIAHAHRIALALYRRQKQAEWVDA